MLDLFKANQIVKILYGSHFLILDKKESHTGSYTFNYHRFSVDGVSVYTFITSANTLRELIWKIHPESDGKRNNDSLFYQNGYLILRKENDEPCETISIDSAKLFEGFDSKGRKYIHGVRQN